MTITDWLTLAGIVVPSAATVLAAWVNRNKNDPHNEDGGSKDDHDLAG